MLYFWHQVSHHPMVMACHCEGKGWKFWGDSNVKSKFWGQTIQLDPVGVLTLEFDDGETFRWSKVNILFLIVGGMTSRLPIHSPISSVEPFCSRSTSIVAHHLPVHAVTFDVLVSVFSLYSLEKQIIIFNLHTRLQQRLITLSSVEFIVITMAR